MKITRCPIRTAISVLPGLAVAVALAGPTQAETSAVSSATDQSFDCVIEPKLIMRLTNPVEGVIDRIEVERGDIVKKGQILARLKASVEEANVSLARLRASNEYAVASSYEKLGFLRRKHDRAEKLKAKNFVASATLEEAATEAAVAEQMAKESELNLKIAKIELERAEALLDQHILRSPEDGIVVERALAPGEYRNAQSHIVTVAQINLLRVETFIPTALHDKIRVGAVAEIEPEFPYIGSYTGIVTVVDRVLDAASGTFGVRLELSNPDHSLPAGLRCKLRFEGDERVTVQDKPSEPPERPSDVMVQ